VCCFQDVLDHMLVYSFFIFLCLFLVVVFLRLL